ncbi:MAG: hypothetical protein LBT14_07395 [Treponema sp.]|jgi:hypothetical protein|nr:hypothetical protein [Treponema sp.]
MKYRGCFRVMLVLGGVLCIALVGWAQDNDNPPDSPGSPVSESELPRVFRDLSLGMGLEDLKGVLQQDALFHFRGDRDVSFLPLREQSLVETTGPSFIRRAFFQLRDGTVFLMAFTLNMELVDHYSVFTSFVKKYGEPGLLDPKQAVWESDTTRIAIERPLTVKYIDKQVFNELLDESKANASKEVRLREDFLDGF